jgi:hypothetical protein
VRGGTPPAVGFAAVAAPPPPASADRGPRESWTVTADDVAAFVKRARAGETFVYAHGPVLVQGAAAARVAQLTQAGEVIPHHRRASDGGFDFLVRRLKRAEARRAPVCDPHMFAVLLVLQDAAAAGQRCPSDAALAEATDLSPDQVKWQLKKLRQAGFVKVATLPTPGDARFRVVTVVAPGATTAGPPA